MRRLSTLLIALLLPSQIAAPLLRMLGHFVQNGARIGFSIVLVDRLCLERGASIGHFNLVACRRVLMRRGAYIQHLNIIRGPLSLKFAERGAVGNRNVIRRAAYPVSYGSAVLQLGELAKITASHMIDCTRSVHLGDFSTLAGIGSQLWTHGYFHLPHGADRFRVDGGITIGRNCYIGSACVIGAGVIIADTVVVGSHSSVSKSLLEPGMYVSQPLRHIQIDLDEITKRLELVRAPCSDRAFQKKSSH